MHITGSAAALACLALTIASPICRAERTPTIPVGVYSKPQLSIGKIVNLDCKNKKGEWVECPKPKKHARRKR